MTSDEQEKMKIKKVLVPAKYRESLKRRFDPANAIQYIRYACCYWEINIPCELCRNYGCNDDTPTEKLCPFVVGQKQKRCIDWIEAVLDEKVVFISTIERITWREINDPKARAQIMKLREKIPNYIEWVENYA